ncbi:MAG: glycoside hydrolase family 130 protein [Fimbriimonadaceae bacterium]
MILALFVLLHGRPPLKPWMLGPFVRDENARPVLKAKPSASFIDPMSGKPVAWEHDNVFNPAEVVANHKLCLLFRAEDASGRGIGAHTSRVGYAASSDGLHFKVRPSPVLFPSNDAQKPYDWPGGCEDPRVVKGPSGYVMTYTSWNKKTARLSVATSEDLIHWRKRGPAFAKAQHGKWLSLWCKSGAIVTRRRGDAIVAAKIAGKYWMFFGDLNVSLATSDNLVDWAPVVDAGGKIKPILSPRPDHFDSALCESGPPALLTAYGVVLLYNGSNAASHGDPALAPGAYSAGQALFDRRHPDHLLDRTDKPFFKPERPYEVTGQYKSGTVFIEGLAWFRRHWVLAYGAADSMVALARSK